MRRSVIGAGNFIVDYVKTIDSFPPEQALANICREYTGSGGAPYNVLRNLAILGASDFDLQAIGKIGDDEAGRYILNDCRELGIDTIQLTTLANAPTSYTLVMASVDAGKRTFFHQRGASALLCPSDFDFSQATGGHLHYGYLLLLDQMDATDHDFGTGAARVLAQAKRLAMTVSVDLVSENSGRFQSVVPPALKYADIVFMNEFEACRLTGVELVEEGKFRADRVSAFRAGVDCGGVVALHWAEGAVACLPDGSLQWQGSVKMPEEQIASVVGSGDAFASGYLLGYLRNQSTEQCLRLGVCAAAACINGFTCTDSMVSSADCLALGARCGFRDCP